MEKWIEPEAYEISRDEYAKDKIVRDIVTNNERMMSMAECILAIQRMATRERDKVDKTTTKLTATKHRALAELYESVIFYLKAKNQVIKAMKN